jgi:hypothetical protein
MASKLKTCIIRYLGGLGWEDVMFLVIVTMFFKD